MEREKSKFEVTMESNSPLQRFVKNKLAMSGLIFIFLMVLVSVFGSVLRLDKTENANDQKLSCFSCPTDTLMQSLFPGVHRKYFH